MRTLILAQQDRIPRRYVAVGSALFVALLAASSGFAGSAVDGSQAPAVEQPFPRAQPVPGEAERLWQLVKEAPDSELMRSDDTFTLHQMVAGWAQAWSEQDVEVYLSYYSDRFAPSGRYAGQSLEAWRLDRAARLRRPESIRISVSSLLVELQSADRAVLYFGQSYSSDVFSDWVQKRIQAQKLAGRWLIVREEAIDP